jgi:hypothetical protein
MSYPEGHKGSIEARRFQRYEMDTEIHVAAFGREKQEVTRGRALNISEAGVAGLFVSGWDMGTAVNLKFFVPVGNSPLSVGAIVRSRSDYRYGVEFVELNPAHARLSARPAEISPCSKNRRCLLFVRRRLYRLQSVSGAAGNTVRKSGGNLAHNSAHNGCRIPALYPDCQADQSLIGGIPS